MRLPAQPWLKVVFFVTAAVFVGVALWVYALRFFAWAESDSSVAVLLASRILEAKRPIVDTWYYANGDVWFFTPQLTALLPVAVLGVGPASLWLAVAGGFVVELIVAIRTYARLCDERWIAWLAAMVTLMAWSRSHIMYVYIQLSYGFVTVAYAVLFSFVARLAERGAARPWRWLAAAAMLAVLAVQNPARGAAYLAAPLLAAVVWPWRGLAMRRRLAIAAAVVAGTAVAWAVYAQVFLRVVELSVPRGHIEFMVADGDGIAHNLARFARGVLLLCAGGGGVLRAIPGLLGLLGAVALVAIEALGSRALTPLRFLCVVLAGQLVVVSVPLLIGNLLVSDDSVRYLLPSLLTMFGLAVILAVRATRGVGRARWLAVGWLGVVPVAALAAVPDTRPPTAAHYVWPDLPELRRIADELVRRKLTHGFANVLGANVLNLQSRGATLACPVYFRAVVMPQRWLADTSCYRASALPAQFYVVIDQGEHDAAALRDTLPPPIDRFRVGATYEVDVFQRDGDLAWLDLPMRDGADATFPMAIAATQLQMRRGEAVVEGAAVVATGTPGSVLYGPYLSLPRGRYELVFVGRGLDSPGELAFSVRAAGGADVIAQVKAEARALPRTSGELSRVRFRLPRARDGLELVVQSGGGGRVAIERLELLRR